jgi:hypothetical protein
MLLAALHPVHYRFVSLASPRVHRPTTRTSAPALKARPAHRSVVERLALVVSCVSAANFIIVGAVLVSLNSPHRLRRRWRLVLVELPPASNDGLRTDDTLGTPADGIRASAAPARYPK